MIYICTGLLVIFMIELSTA